VDIIGTAIPFPTAAIPIAAAEGAPFHDTHFEFLAFPALRASDRTFQRIESGDRGIDPLYISFLDSLGTVRLFSEPRSNEFENSLRAALDERNNKRPPVERALDAASPRSRSSADVVCCVSSGAVEISRAPPWSAFLSRRY
jgi:hypothetical protein